MLFLTENGLIPNVELEFTVTSAKGCGDINPRARFLKCLVTIVGAIR